MKHEWRKKEKTLYQPKTEPCQVKVGPMVYFSIQGQGDPNQAGFQKYIEVLYALSYAVRMSPKRQAQPKGYYEYTVYPLEGVWDLKDQKEDGSFNKEDLVFDLMIRQPDFVTEEYFREMIDFVRQKKNMCLLDQVVYKHVEEGDCVQVMHVGPFERESESFEKVHAFCLDHGLRRQSRAHREIYLSDFRKVSPEKMKTVLRVKV